MDLSKVLEQLRKELANLDLAILTLERLQEKEIRRGRTPKVLAELRDHAKIKTTVSLGLPRAARRGNGAG